MFDIKKRLGLSFLGEGWEDCYLDFRPALVRELAELSALKPAEDADVVDTINKGIKFLEGKFISGKAVKDGKVISIKKDSINDFPMDVLNKCFELFGGETEKKN